MNRALIIAALAAISVDAKASKYAQQRVKQTKTHLEKVYGKGLVGLFDENGRMTHKRIRAAKLRPAHKIGYNSMSLKGLGTFDADSAKASVYGWAKGLEYKLMKSDVMDDVAEFQQSDCFYSMYGMVDTVDLLSYDWQNILADGKFQWFNVMAYDPLHFSGDLSVAY